MQVTQKTTPAAFTKNKLTFAQTQNPRLLLGKGREMELETSTESLSDTGAALQAPFPHPPFYLQPVCWGLHLFPGCTVLE